MEWKTNWKTRWERFKKAFVNFIGDTEEDMMDTLIIKNINKYEQIELLKYLDEMRNEPIKDNFEMIFKD